MADVSRIDVKKALKGDPGEKSVCEALDTSLRRLEEQVRPPAHGRSA
ncbi:hypothetical protein AB0L47_25030 [Streptomyces bobili]